MEANISTGLFTVFRPCKLEDARPRGSADNVFVSAVLALAALIRTAETDTHQRVADLIPSGQQRMLFDDCFYEPDQTLEQLLGVMKPYIELLPEPHRRFFRPESVRILQTADYVVLSRHQEGYWYPHAPI